MATVNHETSKPLTQGGGRSGCGRVFGGSKMSDPGEDFRKAFSSDVSFDYLEKITLDHFLQMEVQRDGDIARVIVGYFDRETKKASDCLYRVLRIGRHERFRCS